MGLTSNGLTDTGMGAGLTTNFQVQYDSALGNLTNMIANANALLSVIEQEYTVTTGWFNTPPGLFGIFRRQIVNLTYADYSGANNTGYGGPINLDAQSGNFNAADAAARVQMLFINEWVEVLMSLTGGAWNSLNSSGEGLSQYSGILEFPVGHYSYYPSFVDAWLNGNPRQDWVNTTEGTDKDPVSFGCALAFLFYLNRQLNFTTTQIIANGAGTLAEVYQNLTGLSNGWAAFIGLVNSHYPLGPLYALPGDILFPVRNLSQFFPPDPIGSGYSLVGTIFIDGPAPAPISIQLVSDNPALVSVPSTVAMPAGALSVTFTVQAAAIPGPFAPIPVNVHAVYGGQTLTETVTVVPPSVSSLTLSPDTVTCGDSSTGTVTLDQPSLLGPAVVDLISGSPGFATVPPQVTIPQNQPFASFTITTPVINTPFQQGHVYIYADASVYAILTINPKVIAGILDKITVFPATVSPHFPSQGTVTLVEAVPVDTDVVLEALDPVVTPHGILPGPGTKSSLVKVPSSVTIPAGDTLGFFSIKVIPAALPPGTKSTVRIMARAVVNRFASVVVTP